MDKYQAFIGKILDGRYRILELVGVGGMAFVLKAEDLVMNRTVAIKILNDRYNGDEQAEKRFINESKAVAMLSSKNIVSVYDVAIYPDIKYIVMEYLDGITLREYMDNKKVLPWKEACVYTLQIIHALEHAHGKNVIHRDIKPQNIILLKSGEVKVTDFGIAKIPDMADITLTDKAIGTVYYISPEQASGKETGFASDIYSVGVMLYEMVTGELPFTADSPVTIAMMQINDTPKNPSEIDPEIPGGVSQIILKAMSKQPENRFKDVHSMLKAVDYVIKNPDVVFSDENENTEKISDELSDELADDEISGKGSDKVNINMIATGDIGDYVVNISENSKTEQPKPDKTQLKAERKRKRKLRRRERPSHSIFPVITGVFFAFMIVAFAMAGYFAIKWVPSLFETEKPSDFFVRDLTDLKYTTDLRNELEQQGYIIEIAEVYRQGLGFNVIVDQDPAMGNIRTSDGKCRIKISVNKYPDNLTVPDVKYMTASEAEKILKQYNLY
ncbi:MAG: protein kinase, partial [Eubacteriales bacterium]|nr:protein kinase [Eubacteriales bacterium]